jgi:septum formation protein
MQLILASASPRRLDLLKQIGITPARVIATDCDESVLKGESPRETAVRLSALKAANITLNPDEILLAADTVVGLGIRQLPKAMNDDEVKACLTLLSGRAHRVYTGVTMRTFHKTITRVVETRLTFKRLSQEEIDAYIKGGEGIGKAGGYAIQGHAACFITKLAGSHSNVIGLPLFETAQMLGGLGFAPFKQWGNA